MLEALSNHLRSYGMDDLEFIIVNSKLSHAQERVEELRNRVSFEVFQETEQEEVWDVMEGGKDDMYVYDRCGRLTYYIPFPLSILNESPLVSNAILATYFRSPCGDKCDQNNTIEIEDFVKNIEKQFESSNQTEKDNATFVTEDTYTGNNETNNETLSSNDLQHVIDAFNEEIDVSNSTGNLNITDYDYPSNNNSSLVNETNSSTVGRAKSIFTSIYKLFFNIGTNDNETSGVHDYETSTHSTTQETTTNNSTIHQSHYNSTTEKSHNKHLMHQSHINNHLHHHIDKHHTHHHDGENEDNKQKGKKTSDRCLEADYEVCKSWSKKRLLHAQKCCSENHSNPELQDRRTCAHFGKKRCKKIQSILKCCIKTVYTEPTVDVPREDHPTTTKDSGVEESSTAERKTEEENSDVVCCKQAKDGKLCRVATEGICKEDEYEDRSSTQSK